ncbi:hypothetical protein [Streptomyces sp. WZ-12]|uniref:hypothetical protein n=1 Tax=Streptomyces sp. WZ-12 TaxID=3030210 RepID=UPI0023814B6E|nr:hypothetical protein [Streptomyces sp. WZ-12]
MTVVERLDTFLSHQDASDYLHAYARNLTRLKQTPRYGVRIGERVWINGKPQWPIYLIDSE